MDNRTADSPAALAPARPRKRRVLLQCMAVLAKEEITDCLPMPKKNKNRLINQRSSH